MCVGHIPDAHLLYICAMMLDDYDMMTKNKNRKQHFIYVY